jgi:hypothetical protein
MRMTRLLTKSAVLKELVGVTERLATGKVTSQQRLVLLRRQAELGDLRDALIDRARRNAV